MSQTRPPRPPAVREQISSTLKTRRERERAALGVLDALGVLGEAAPDSDALASQGQHEFRVAEAQS